MYGEWPIQNGSVVLSQIGAKSLENHRRDNSTLSAQMSPEADRTRPLRGLPTSAARNSNGIEQCYCEAQTGTF
jgi:hypothetical protein